MYECEYYQLAGGWLRYNALEFVILMPVYFDDEAVLAVIEKATLNNVI